ncbi:MAG: septum formation protein Maf [Bernardetiaceae bacterium]|nr:septum formation protein Maf [Bernardetiaceae bacterium]
MQLLLSEILPILSTYQIVLGSASPRRQTLCRELGLDFILRKADIDEQFPAHIPAKDLAVYLAEAKAVHLEDTLSAQELLITADTVVVSEGIALAKPADYEEAQAMLESLSDAAHEVVTGVCILTKQHKVVFSDTTKVYFKTLSPNEIDFYIRHFEPYDKAGSYGIQEWIGMIGIEKIEGDYFNVMGLPMFKLYGALRKILLA